MAENIFSGYHDEYQVLAAKYGRAKNLVNAAKPLNDLAARVNASAIPDAVATLFVRPYNGLSETKLLWRGSDEQGNFPEEVTIYEKDANILFFNHLAFLKFLEVCAQAPGVLNTRSGRADFRTYRHFAFLAELHKLPSQYLLFMQILRAVAHVTDVSKGELRQRKELCEDTDIDYMTMLWSFKELEIRMALTSHKNIRAEHKIFWYESEWIDGN